MATVQSRSARVALVSGEDLMAILRKRSPRVVYLAVFLLVVASTWLVVSVPPAIGPGLMTFGWAATGGMFLALLALLYAAVV